MDKISKEHVIAGMIGGLTTLALSMVARKMFMRRFKGMI